MSDGKNANQYNPQTKDDIEEEEIMDDEEEMEIPSPEGGGSSSGHFVIPGNPVISSPPQMVSSLKTVWAHNRKLFQLFLP